MPLSTIPREFLRRWNSWSLPTRLGLLLGFVGLPAFGFSIFAWLMPELGPKIVSSLNTPPAKPNDWDSLLAERARAAATEAMEYKIPSSEIVVAKLFREPRIADGRLRYDIPGWVDRKVDFISVSPTAPSAMDRTFPGAACEVEGVVDDLNTTNHRARIRLTEILCRDPSGRQYGATGHSLGFAALAPSLATDTVDLDFDGKSYAMKASNYILRFKPPLESLHQYKTYQ